MQRALLSVALAGATSLAGAQSANGWPVSTPEAQQMNAAPLRALIDGVQRGTFGNADRLVVVRNGVLVVNETITRDYREVSRGKRTPIGCGSDMCTPPELHEYNYLHPDFHPWWQGSELHTLQSVTKSVTATLFGVAMQRGQLKDVSSSLLSHFGKYDVSKVDPRLQKATLEDLLTMRSGIEWHEQDRPLDSTNTTLQLETSTDWIRFTLSQPMDADPQDKWAYNSGGSALMAEVIRDISGMHADEYARRFLFEPLGIRSFKWKKTPTGHPDTEGGLYLAALDLAKVGQLYLNDGAWNGQQILKAGFAATATARHVDHINANPNSPGYGYQWWRYDRRGVDVWAGNGFGGQFLVIIPARKVVAVANSWNVFGTPATGMLVPLIDALIEATN